jgi:L,D-peptidoglycan transpeptidase YkuD (ErfK/YbiS/YcfS/YnhG family)
MPPRLVSLLLLACSWPLVTGRGATPGLDRSRQCVVVLTDNWKSTTGVLNLFGRSNSAAEWKEELGPGLAVVVGKNGLGLGRGLIPLNLDGAPRKQEGDNRAPAGLFRLSSAFGYAPKRSARWIRLPYLALTEQIEGIDDPNSRYYNKLVDRSQVANIDWRSSEKMKRDDVLYKWGLVVDHNSIAVPGAGSCIFLHIWKSPASPTVGCTAMPESDLIKLLRWLDPVLHPILVQMPRAPYHSVRATYGLPPDES